MNAVLGQRPPSRWKLWAVLAICIAPVLASYLTYYIIKPSARSNHGDLIEPQRPVPAFGLTTLDGATFDLQSLRGKWVMLHFDGAACPEACAKQLYIMRQIRATQGKNQSRIERVWLVADGGPVDPKLIDAYAGMHIARGNTAELRSWLTVSADTTAEKHIFLIDPLGNLMLRWPEDVDPTRMKRDLSRLLKASRIG